MADDTRLNIGSSGDKIRTIEKSGVKTQVVTLDVGGSGSESLVEGTIPISGTVSLAGAQTEGGVTTSPVVDVSAITLLNNILKEIRIMNIQLAMMTDNEIQRSDIDA